MQTFHKKDNKFIDKKLNGDYVFMFIKVDLKFEFKGEHFLGL